MNVICLRGRPKTSIHGTLWTKGKIIGNEVKEAGRGQIMQATVVVVFVIGGFKQGSNMRPTLCGCNFDC